MNADDDSKSRRSSKRVAQAAEKHISGSTSQSSDATKNGGKKDKTAKRKKTTTVNFSKLDMMSLLRYSRYHRLPVRLAAPKIELVHYLKRHFLHHPKLKDGEVIAAFLWANKKHMRDGHKGKE